MILIIVNEPHKPQMPHGGTWDWWAYGTSKFDYTCWACGGTIRKWAEKYIYKHTRGWYHFHADCKKEFCR